MEKMWKTKGGVYVALHMLVMILFINANPLRATSLVLKMSNNSTGSGCSSIHDCLIADDQSLEFLLGSEVVTNTTVSFKYLSPHPIVNCGGRGRATLIKAVTSALPVYTMQAAKLPSEICHNLDKLNRNFLYGHTLDKKTIHLISWDTVCIPKRNGGLGIKKMKDTEFETTESKVVATKKKEEALGGVE
ncbi:hypothetical protein Dsin_013019 [Dipteronia sinensis]|uniref:Uncharacterized protein n=1 Tax=Dipteronia sinensis TaxID=43782 RepID=A0AAE0AKD6_9ROSI|nr:hypothetical protein Dsin_013019 [Dipteronia sinensis]